MIEAGFFDLDKTTIDEHGRAYAGLCEALDAAPALARTILTGRGYPRFREAIAENPALAASRGMPIALENGARIVDGTTYENVHYHALSSEEQDAIFDFIDRTGTLRYIAFHSRQPRAKTLLWSPNRAEAERLHTAYSHNAHVFTSSKKDLYRSINQHNPCMITCRTNGDAPQNMPEIAFYAHGATVDFMPKGSDKGTAAHIIADMQNVDISQTMAAGNDHNDKSMLGLAGLGLPVLVGDDMATDTRVHLPEHTVYLSDPTTLGDFILKAMR